MGNNVELSLEEEKHLKKLLFQQLFERELDTVLQQPNVHHLTQNTLMLKHLYHFLIDFPLFGPEDHQKFKSILIYVVHALPQLTATSTGATKRDFKLQLRSLLVKCALFMFLGRKEKVHYNQTQGDPASEPPSSAQPTASPSPGSPPLAQGKPLFDAMQRMLMHLQANHGQNVTTALFDMVRAIHHISLLPPIFQELVAHMKNNTSDWAIENFTKDGCQETKSLAKLKKIHSMIPQTIVLGILKIANPFALTQGFVNLFVARPFGVKNLMQRVMESLLRLSETEDEIKRIKKTLNYRHKHVAKKMKAHFAKKISLKTLLSFMETLDKNKNKNPQQPHVLTYEQSCRIREIINEILVGTDTRPLLHPHVVHSLSDNEYVMIWRWVELQARKEAKTMFIDFIGSDLVITVFKELIPILYMPLMSLYNSDDLGSLVRGSFALIEGMIRVAEDKRMHPSEQHHRYGVLFDGYCERVYRFVHIVANVDKRQGGAKLEGLANWSLKFYMFNKKLSLEVDPLLDALEPSKRESVMAELKQVMAHKAQKKELKHAIKDCKMAGNAVQAGLDGKAKLEGLETALKKLVPPKMEHILDMVTPFRDVISAQFKQAGFA